MDIYKLLVSMAAKSRQFSSKQESEWIANKWGNLLKGEVEGYRICKIKLSFYIEEMWYYFELSNIEHLPDNYYRGNYTVSKEDFVFSEGIMCIGANELEEIEKTFEQARIKLKKQASQQIIDFLLK